MTIHMNTHTHYLVLKMQQHSLSNRSLMHQGIWGGMIFGGTFVQTVILAIITARCDWEKEVGFNIVSLPFSFIFFLLKWMSMSGNLSFWWIYRLE